MAIEKTYVMLKPDCIRRGLTGELIARIERKGYRLIEAKMMLLDEAILREHYAHIAHIESFPQIIAYMTSGPVLAMVVEGGERRKRRADSHGRHEVRRGCRRDHSR